MAARVLACALVCALALPAWAADEEPLPEGAAPPKREDAPATAPIGEDRAPDLPSSVYVRAAVAAREADVQACARPDDGRSWKSGRVLVNWRIEPDGAVTDVAVGENTTGDDGIGECFARLVSELRFQPTPSGKPARVSYPFRVVAPEPTFWGWLSGLFGCG